MNGPAIVIAASSFGTTICQRGSGESVRFASVRSSTSLAKAAPAMASTTSGAMEPASIALRTTVSNSRTEGALRDASISTAMTTGRAASTVMTTIRQRPDSWRSVRK